MPYNAKQYNAALDFLGTADANIVSAWDQKRIQAYDLYENLYINSTVSLKIVLRGDDQTPILMPSGRKIVEATNRFLGKNLQYFVDAGGDEGTRQVLDLWWQDFFKREAIVTKFNSSKRWGLVRGDGALMVSANPGKISGSRLSIEEVDPRYIFEIEDSNGKAIGMHIVEAVQDFRDPTKLDKKVARRRTFRKVFDDFGQSIGVSSELTFWEIGKWDDRDPVNAAKMQQVVNPGIDEEAFMLPSAINQLPVYKWSVRPPQNSSWGHSILSGLETLLYSINQSLSDEDATIVFQGLGMYVTTSGPPRDPTTGEVAEWNIGPKQIIEINQDQRFERVTGVTDVSPFTNHMTFIDEKGLSEASGTPEIAIGRVDVAVAESGISLQLQLMPLLTSNAELELEMITILDQMFHDITTMWLPGYEPELFANFDVMQEMSVVCLFDDPMPRNRDAEVQEVVLLDSSGMILKSMAVAKLRSLGWAYPSVDAYGNPLTDDDIAQMLLDQSAAAAAALDPYASGAMTDPNAVDPNANTPDQQTIDLGVTG